MRSGSNKLAHSKEQNMKTFEELKAVFTQELLELEKQAGIRCTETIMSCTTQ